MALTVRIIPGKTFSESEVVTTSGLNSLGNPTAEIEGIADQSQLGTSFPDYTGTGSDITGQGTVTISAGVVDASKLANDAVVTSKIINDAVTEPKIADDAVTNDKLAADSVDSDQIVDASVDLIHLSTEVSDKVNSTQKFYQTVISGPVSSGVGNCLTDNSGTPRISGASTNVVAAFSSGFNTAGPQTYQGRVTTNLDAGSGLAAWERAYVYLDRNSSTGAVTCDWSKLRPEVGFALPASPEHRETPMNFIYSDAGAGGTDTDQVRFYDYSAYQNPFNKYLNKTAATGGVKFNPFGSSPFIDVVMPRKTRVTKFRVWMPGSGSYFSSSFKIYGSNTANNGHGDINPDYDSWTLLATVTGLTQTYTGVDLEIPYGSDGTNFGQGEYLAYKIESTDNTLTHCTLFQLSIFEAYNHFFSLSENKMYSWNGSAWEEKQRVFVGEASRNASTVTSTTYAYRGYYESDVQSLSSAFTVGTTDAVVEVPANIGTERAMVQAFIRREAGYPWTPAKLYLTEIQIGNSGWIRSAGGRLVGMQPLVIDHNRVGAIRMQIVSPDVSRGIWEYGSFNEKTHSMGSPYNPFSFPAEENSSASGIVLIDGATKQGNEYAEVKFIACRDY
jgi:hypothetical protein